MVKSLPYKRKYPIQRRRTVRRPTRPPRRMNPAKIVALGSETKKKQVATSETSLSTLGGYYYSDSQQNLTQGDGYSGFEGHFVANVGTSFRYMIHNTSAQTVYVRAVIICNKRGSADVAYQTGVGLFDTNSGNEDISTSTEQGKMFNRINRDKYWVAMDRIIKLSPNGVDNNDSATFRKWIPHKLERGRYDGSGALPQKNNWAMLMWASRADMDTSLGNTVEITGINVFYYKDI